MSESTPAYKAPLFEPLARQPASHRISKVIEQKILRRSLRPGDDLPTETELAEQFAVNRSTVREALRRLESAGSSVVKAAASVSRSPGPATRKQRRASVARWPWMTSRSSNYGKPCVPWRRAWQRSPPSKATRRTSRNSRPSCRLWKRHAAPTVP